MRNNILNKDPINVLFIMVKIILYNIIVHPIHSIFKTVLYVNMFTTTGKHIYVNVKSLSTTHEISFDYAKTRFSKRKEQFDKYLKSISSDGNPLIITIDDLNQILESNTPIILVNDMYVVNGNSRINVLKSYNRDIIVECVSYNFKYIDRVLLDNNYMW